MRRFALTLLLLSAATLSAQQQPSAHPLAPSATASTFPTHEASVDLPNFRFGTGETLPTLHLRYLTLGTPHRNAQGHTDNAVLLLHGTGGNASTLLNATFANPLFGPGEPLDISKYFLILPDDIGHGQSSKPSDGLHAHFPAYDYDDMVRSQRLMLDAMHIDHLRLILGTSMGCMQSFVWGETYAGFADALAPFACLPVPLAGRNRMWRYMAIRAIQTDPEYHNGDYIAQPIHGLTFANDLLLLAGQAPLQTQKNLPTRPLVEQFVDSSIARSDAATDANNMLFYLNASRNYDPSAALARITVPVLWINSADDFINPPELGIAQQLVTRMPHARFVLIPISDATRGHGSHTIADLWKQDLARLLKDSEPN